jgi:site-specific DNA recombinase
LYAIAEGLTRDGIPSPSAYDRARYKHRCGLAWSKAAVRVILSNPRDTGHQVWNKQRKDEVLIDVEDVALGHQTRMRWNDPTTWIWSDDIVHEPLIDISAFQAAQDLLAAAGRRAGHRKPRRTPRDYALTGLMFCGLCQRRMQGSWNNGILACWQILPCGQIPTGRFGATVRRAKGAPRHEVVASRTEKPCRETIRAVQ